MSLGHTFIWEKARPSRDPMLKLGALRLHVQRGIVIFCISTFKKVVLTICW